MKVTAKLDKAGIKSDAMARIRRAQFALDNRVAQDSNYFCPLDTGALQGSVFPIAGDGVLEWNTPYAREQYYERPNKSKDSNPNASMKWFERAKAQFRDAWVRLANAEYNR